ncbi:DNA translocase FtsK 4TM domain-containing protein [Caldithrix abyssi]
MARKKKNKSKQSSRRHKRQALGVLLMGVSLIIALAVITHDLRDPVSLQSIGQGVVIHNWFGRLGAVLSYYLMQWTLGYPILILPLILAIYAIQILLDRTFDWFWKTTFALLAWGTLFSVFLAMPAALRTDGAITEYFPSGLIGGWLASKLVIFFGGFGSIALLVIITLTLLILSIRLEVAPILVGLAFLFDKMFHGLKNGLAGLLRRLKQLRLKPEAASPGTLPDQANGEEQKASDEEIPEINLPLARIKEDLTEETPEPESETDDLLDQLTEDTTEDLLDRLEEEKTAGHGIQTDLDSLLAQLEEKEGKEAEQRPRESAQADSNGNEAFDFEVQEEVNDKELDYDRMLKESISRFEFPSTELLSDPPEIESSVTREELKANADLLESRLEEFGVKAKVIRVTAGPVITLYEVQPAPGVKVSSIVSLANDLALAMEARGIRIIAPIPGRAAVGIEIPNRNPQTVYLKPLIRSEKFAASRLELPIALGKTISGESYVDDLSKMPHLLVAGATGAGKSVGINTMLMSLIYAVNPAKVKFVLIDPKRLELSIYEDLKDHYLLYRPDLDEVVITKPKNAVSILNTLVLEMDRRLDWLSTLKARNIAEFNEKVRKMPGQKEGHFRELPYIVVVIDELADLMVVAQKEVEAPIARLAQMARAVGIHLVVATQRPSVDVITGVIKANIPARIAYMVSSKVDSRTILDMNGAEQLLGRGDMLYQAPGSSKPIRLQNPFISTEEIERVIEHIRKQPKMPYYSLPQPGSSSGAGVSSLGDDRDPFYDEARELVIKHRQGSISFLQRRLQIGFSRAARIMDELEKDGIVGPQKGSKPREVLVSIDELKQMRGE